MTGRPGLEPRVAALAPVAARYVAIDTELTGLDERSDSILSLGGVRIIDGRIKIRETFYEEVRPTSGLRPESIVVHGITPAEMLGKPALPAILGKFVEFCGTDILVGHFIELDLIFLRKELSGVPGLTLGNPALDTWPLYEWFSRRASGEESAVLPRLKDPRLNTLARALHVDCRGSHNSLADAFITAQVFQRLLRKAAQWGIHSVGDLLRIGDPRRPVDHDGGEIPIN